MRLIERFGGLGFDWSMREAWRAWKAGTSDGSVLAHSDADPNKFENNVAGIARHLASWGLTRDIATANPEWYRQRLADAIAVYNSGKPLSESENFRQSGGNRKTTGQYVLEAMATSEAVAGVFAAHVALAAPECVVPNVFSHVPLTEYESNGTTLKVVNVREFGVSVDYQIGGRHTGDDFVHLGPDGLQYGGGPVYAVGDAVVAHVGPLYLDGYNNEGQALGRGNAVVLNHGDNVHSIYSHLQYRPDLKVGQRVAGGQPIGRVGSTGWSRGNHLHFEVHTGALFTGDWEQPFAGGQFVNPSECLPPTR